MKKLLLFALLSIVLVGCADGKEDEIPNFIGKTYVRSLVNIISFQEECTYNIRFIDDTKYEFAYKKGDKIVESLISTYQFNNPEFIFLDFGVEVLREDKKGIFIDNQTISIGGKGYFCYE